MAEKIMTPAKGTTLYQEGRKRFRHGDKLPPTLVKKVNAKKLEEWKEPPKKESEKAALNNKTFPPPSDDESNLE